MCKTVCSIGEQAVKWQTNSKGILYDKMAFDDGTGKNG